MNVPNRTAPRLLRIAAVLAAALSTACGATALQVPEATVPTLQAGGLARPVLTVTDLDTVRDVVETTEGLWVATDRGLLLYRSEDASRPRRFTRELPSEDVRALVAMPNGPLVVVTAGGAAGLSGEAVLPDTLPLPAVGELVAMKRVGSKVWACGSTGLARLDQSWTRFGEPVECTGLFPATGDALFAGTTRGLLYIDGDVVREHGEGRGLPAGYVRSVVDTGEGTAFALVQDGTRSFLAHFDGNRWFTYTIAGFEAPIVALERVNGAPALITRTAAFALMAADAEGAAGAPLVPLQAGDRGRVLAYRARLGGPEPEAEAAEALPPRALASVPENLPTVRAPGFYAKPLGLLGSNVYATFPVGDALLVADRNNGLRTPNGDRELRSRDLVASRDLQVGVDANGSTWVLTDEGVVATWDEGESGLVRVPTPRGLRPWSLASADEGLYVAATKIADPNSVVVFRRNRNAWSPVVERRLTLGEGEELGGVPMMAAASDGSVWVAVRLRGATPGAGRLRGVAVLRPDDETITYHHRGATPETDGPGALSMPDDFSNLDLADAPNAWLSTISGAVRLGDAQAVVFGEARGVRGEVVSDVLVGTEGKVWMAAAEGPGYYFNREFEFRMPANVKAARPIALALDRQGRVWGAGGNGLVVWNAGTWSVLGEGSGLPAGSFGDIETDARDRLWLLGESAVYIVLRGEMASVGDAN